MSKNAYLLPIDHLPVVIVFTDAQTGMICFANQYAIKTFGLSLEALTKTSLVELLQLQNSQNTKIHLPLSATQLHENIFQIKAAHQDSHIWVEVHADDIEYEDRNCICVSLKELSEGQLMLSEFTQTNTLYQNLMRISPNAAFITDTQGKIIFCSPHSHTLFSYHHQDELLNTRIFDLLVPNEVTRARQQFASALEGMNTGVQEYIAINKAGATFWLELSVGVIKQPNQPPKSILLVGRDISYRKKIEADLQTQETHYRTLIESARSVILHMSPDGHLLFVNKYAEEFFGYGPGELIGQHVVGTIVPETESMTNRDLRQMIIDIFQDTQNYRININENMLKNGRRVWIAWSNGAIYDNQGRLVEICSVGNDVTDHRQAKLELEATHQQLQLQYQEIHALQDKLREQATRDPLTNLFNRRYLEETLLRELARCLREKIPLAIVMIDIDFFKQINDSYGHEAGDLILQQAATLLQHNTRNEDVVCRYGGEEFIAVLPGASIEKAQERAEFWRVAFEKLIFTSKGITHGATLSCGVSAYPQHTDDPDELIKLADDALYYAKSHGRNQVALPHSKLKQTT
ncbi:MAG: diguanylate cyclase [Methylophilaceae bacterium]|uniref:sensor domain-containing diguanylate cyclase n=1 Tax=Methylovorus sp. MM2 TaxID=1848038 RepID=UPI0007E11E1E|nr:sensor domain-containing diguanylate cyclase [Methylovorus sp. MM2]OAM51280.1 hypothetical protein A7981_11150 [Methylovorus sp. MM2]